MNQYFGFFADLIKEAPAAIEEQEFYYGDTVELYDQICRGDNELPFFLQAIALHGGPVLDLCCGSGRLTIPLARHGTEVTGVDLSPDMLAKLESNLRQKSRRLADRIKLYCQDMTKLDLPEQYGVVLIGATSIRLLQGDFCDFFNSLYDYVRPGGCLCFDMEDLPDGNTDIPKTGELIAASAADQEGRLSILLFQRKIDALQRQACVNMAKILPGTTKKVLLTSTQYRTFGLDEIKAAALSSRFGNIETTAYNGSQEYFCKLVKQEVPASC